MSLRRPLLTVATCIALAGLVHAQAPASPDHLRKFFSYEVDQSPGYELRTSRKMDGFELRDISYASPQGGTVTAFLLVPTGTGPFPAVVYGHWGNGTRASFLPEAMALARAGVVVLIPDAPFARAGESYKALNGPEARSTYVQMVVDVRYGIDLLERERPVDRARIGFVGLSYGSQIGAILAGIEPRVRAVILMGGLPSLARTLEHGTGPALVRMRESIEDKAGFTRFVRSIAEIDSERFVGGKHAPILFQFGEFDAAIPEADARTFIRATSEPKEVRWYAVGHDFNDLESLNDRFAWLGKQLGFVAPCARVQASCAAR